MLRPGPAVTIERPPTAEEVIDERRARLTLVALRAQEDDASDSVVVPVRIVQHGTV
jgi:hypothetical protein